MPGVNLNQPLLGAGAAARNDWAAASARTSLDFSAQAEFTRGLNVRLGLSALAQADAGLAQFVAATVRGNAFAEAAVSAQVQFPLNLFRQFGLAVGAEAKAQAAAGIEAGLGLVVGDFIELIERDPDVIGLPLDLVLLLLEEVDLGGKIEVHVAASAMAYASLKVTGTIVDRPGQPAGFQYVVDAGLGLAAGMGFSGGLTLGFKDFRHFYGRAVDLCVDTTVRDITHLLGEDTAAVRSVAGAFGPVAKLALRLSYELGDVISKNNPAQDSSGAQTLANHCVGVLLEESQRFLLERLLETGLNAARDVVQGSASVMNQSAWDAVRPQRHALAQRLFALPADPFQPTDENRAYWRGLQQNLLTLADRLPVSTGAPIRQGVATIGAAVELLFEMFRSRINAAQAYVVAVGVGQITTRPSFGGTLPATLLDGVPQQINAALGRAASSAVGFPDLVAFLTRPAQLDNLRAAFPEVARFADIFSGPTGRSASDVLSTFLTNREAFLPDANGDINPRHTLEVLLGALDGFIGQRLNTELKQRVYAATPDEVTRLYFDEVLLAAINSAKDVAFRTALDWDTAPLDKDTFTEALASVVTMLVGRGVVIIGDQFFDTVAHAVQTGAAHAANHLDGPHSAFAALGLQRSPELERLFTDTLRIGGEVFGPLPLDTRARIRHLLYEAMEPLPPSGARALVDDLADQFFIPSGEHVDALRAELLAISQDRFASFVEKVLLNAGEMLLEAMTDFVNDAIAQIGEWERQVRAALEDLSRRLADLLEAIAALTTAMEAAFGRSVDAFEALLETLSRSEMRAAFKSRIVNALHERAKGALRQHPVYKALPREFKGPVRSLLKDTIRGLVDNPIVDPILDVVGDIAGRLDDVIDDVRSLDPHRPLEPQVVELVLSRLEQQLHDHFGSTRPHVSIGFSFTYDFFGMHTVRFELGRVELPLSTLFSLIRNAVEAAGSLDDAVAALASDLAEAFALQIELEDKEAARAAALADEARLARIDREHSATPKQIAVLSPAPASVHGGDVRVIVRLGDVPRSYLGLAADEEQRVFVLVNGRLLPPETFDLVTVPTPAPNGDAPPATVPTRPVALRRPRRPGVERRVAAARDGRTITSTTLTRVLPGRLLTPSQVRAIGAELPEGLEISCTIAKENLVQGANTLAVLLIDRGGRQYEQIVSFGVAGPPGRIRPDSAIARLPVRGAARSRSDASAGPMRPSIGAGLSSAAMADGLRRATVSVRERSAANLQRLSRTAR